MSFSIFILTHRRNWFHTILKSLVYLLITPLIVISCSKETVNDDDTTNEIENIEPLFDSARVVGYLPYYRFSDINKIALCKITHLNIAFVNPDIEGNLSLPNSSALPYTLTEIISIARSKNPQIKIFVSLAGGALTEQQQSNWRYFVDKEENRPTLIDKITAFVQQNGFDGVDVDLEWDNVTEGYSEFITDLKNAMTLNSKLLTAALPSETLYTNITADALNAFDFINIMAYDYTGPWSPGNPGPHSSISHAERGIQFWRNTAGVLPEKLNLGVPFYGWDFQSNSVVKAKTYGQIVNQSTSNADIDVVGNLFYNGRVTIREKTRMAAQRVGGIMIWELGQDAFNDFSLLNIIHQSYIEIGVETTGLCEN